MFLPFPPRGTYQERIKNGLLLQTATELISDKGSFRRVTSCVPSVAIWTMWSFRETKSCSSLAHATLLIEALFEIPATESEASPLVPGNKSSSCEVWTCAVTRILPSADKVMSR